MSRPDPIEVVARVIDQASEKRGWSLAQLTRRLGKGDNTLFRWRSGKTHSMDIRSIVQLFELAGVSMDDAFGLQIGEGTDSSISESRYLELRSDIAQIRDKLAMVEPVAVLLQSLGTSMLAAESAGRQDEEDREARARVPSDTALRKTLRRARSAGTTEKKSATRRRKAGKSKRA